jgi:integrase
MAAERFRITKFTNPSGEQVWRVEGRMPDGHRVRQNFGDRADAIAKKAELELQALNQPVTLSLKRTRLTDEQLTEAEAAFLKLHGKGSLLGAVHHYLISGQKQITRITVREAYDLYMADAVERHLRPRTIQERRSRVGFLVAAFGDRWLDELRNPNFRPVVYRHPDQAAITSNGNLRVLNGFLNWCVENDFLAVNPLALKKAQSDEKEQETISLAQVKALLWAAITFKTGVVAPYFAGALFAGLRPEELDRLSYDKIDREHGFLNLDGKVTKLHRRRMVAIKPNYLDWLDRYWGKPFVGKNWRRHFDAVRKAAGFQVGEDADDEERQTWVADVLRHTALSNFYAICHDEKLTAAWAGHSVDTLRKHYRANVPPHEAEAFWAITPTSLEAEFGSRSGGPGLQEHPVPDDADLIRIERSSVLQT